MQENPIFNIVSGEQTNPIMEREEMAKKERKGPPSKEQQEKNRQLYEKIWKIFTEAVTPEGLHKFSLKSLCEKHEVSYGGFNLWRSKNTRDVSKPKSVFEFQPKPKEEPAIPIVGQNRIIIRIDDLADLVSRLVRDNLRHYVRDLEKARKISIID